VSRRSLPRGEEEVVHLPSPFGLIPIRASQ
jgi:hypothetical protein